MAGWAIDLGTTNTGVARWDDTAQRPRLVELPDICRQPGGEDHLEAPRLVPSATHVIEEDGFAATLGRWRFFARRSFMGTWGHIGRQALELNEGQIKPNFAPSFKRYLGNAPLRTLARVGKRTYSARDVARIFVRQLFAEVKSNTGERIRELVVTTPVDVYESYRAEVSQIMRGLGVRRVRFIDEPVAAAIGYGLGMKHDRIVLVADYGGGTLDLALVRMTARGVQEGTCEVLAKEGRPIGGNLVDQWLLEHFLEEMGYPLRNEGGTEAEKFWWRLMLNEARRVKEAVFFRDSEQFNLTPPEELRSFEARIRGELEALEVTKQDVVDILTKNGMYDILEECIVGIEEQTVAQGIDLDAVEDVLMVGGSTLLPQVYPAFEKHFGRDRVRAWQPFEAVAYGASAFSADSFDQSDFIVHDYAFVTYDLKTHKPRYTVIVPRGTRFPTPPDFWKRQLVPTCSLGEPETMFKLVVCEIGENVEGDRRFQWDERGELHKVGGDKADGDRLVVPLNESNPTLGYLKPPHPPSDKRPRLEIQFGVNEDRWLCATVQDLKTSKTLMKGEPVVRLL